MSAIKYDVKKIDVICQHSKDGRIYPLKIRFDDEDGNIQTYNVRSFKDHSRYGSYKMPNEIVAVNGIYTFDCKILFLDTEKIIRIVYHSRDNYWFIPGFKGYDAF